MSRYTPEVRRVFKTIRPPFPDYIVDIVEYPNTLTLRFYEDLKENYSDGQKIQIAEYLYRLRDAIRTMEPCELEGVEGKPPNVTA